MGSQQVPGLCEIAVVVSAVPVETVSPRHCHPLHQNQGMLPLLPAHQLTAQRGRAKGRAGPRAGGSPPA